MRIAKETLDHDGRPIFEFQNGEAKLYHDDYKIGPTYPFDWTLSGVGTLHERPDNRKLTAFKKDLQSFIIVNPCPPFYVSETRTEDELLDPLMKNFVGWYRHYSLENMGSIGDLFAALRRCLPAFSSIRLRNQARTHVLSKRCSTAQEVGRSTMDSTSFRMASEP